MLDRRTLLVGGMAMACTRRLPPAPSAAPPTVRLGWRLVPGQRLTWLCTQERTIDTRTERRQERWTYLVERMRPDGTAVVRGQLTGFGAELFLNKRRVDDASLALPRWMAERDTPASVTFLIGLNGRLHSLDTPDFAHRLPHLMLDTVLPAAPVAPGSQWEDRSLVLPFQHVVPIGLPLRPSGQTTLATMPTPDRPDVVVMEHQASLTTTDDGPSVHLVGSTAWNLVMGVPLRRQHRVTPEPAIPQAGVLDVTIQLLGPDDPNNR